MTAVLRLGCQRKTLRYISDQSGGAGLVGLRADRGRVHPARIPAVVATATLVAAAAWPYSRPPEALQAAYAADPTLATLRTDFTDQLRQSLAVTISGLLARHDDRPA